MRALVVFGLLLVGCAGTRVEIGGFTSGVTSVMRETGGDRDGIDVRVTDSGVEVRLVELDQRIVIDGAKQYRGVVWPDRADLVLLLEDDADCEVRVRGSEVVVSGGGREFRRERANWPPGTVEVVRAR